MSMTLVYVSVRLEAIEHQIQPCPIVLKSGPMRTEFFVFHVLFTVQDYIKVMSARSGFIIIIIIIKCF